MIPDRMTVLPPRLNAYWFVHIKVPASDFLLAGMSEEAFNEHVEKPA